ncbi:MAG: 16S rRNA (guanine(966)-N(2))-methyltransferase RsmD [Myxococcaceae bacterium]|nr:16S rRNA (guanine(966)-N(2))-methyltransferase RsmD [Myxococcaceae bacterium]
MRIVAGTAKGRILLAPKNAQRIRPTADRVRESIFNILGQSCDGLVVLDLYAGTGALGLEAISRGAVSAVLVDRDREALDLCRDNTQALGFATQVEIVAGPVEKAMSRLSLSHRSFDLVFIDPPYADEAGTAVVTTLCALALLTPQARVCVEHSKHEVLPTQIATLSRIDQRRFGETMVSFFQSEVSSSNRVKISG